MINSVLKVIRGIVKLRGGTDNTIIGNTNDSLKVNVTNGSGGSAVNIQDGGNSITVDAVSLPLPTGAATSANQVTGNTSLSSIDDKTPTLGQKTMAGSSPVVIASDQTDIPASQSGTWAVRNQDGLGNNLTSELYDTQRPLHVLDIRQGADTSTLTRVTLTTGNTAQIVLSANSARKWLYINNNSGANITIGFGYVPVAGQGLTLSNNTLFTMDVNNLYLGAIYAIAPSNNRTIDLIEGY